MTGRLLLLCAPALTPAAQAQPSAHEIIERTEQVVWGRTLQAQITMTVRTPRWERTLRLQAWAKAG